MQTVITDSDESLICSMANKILPILFGTDLKLHQRQHIQYKSVRRATHMYYKYTTCSLLSCQTSSCTVLNLSQTGNPCALLYCLKLFEKS